MTGEIHFVEGGDLESLIDLETSRDAINYLMLHQPSCHSDTGEALMQSAKACGDWIAFSPSFKRCLYVALVTDRTIFAIGHGQQTVAYRLPEAVRAHALSTGAAEAANIGPDWVRFEIWTPNRPLLDLSHWTLRAYAAVWERSLP